MTTQHIIDSKEYIKRLEGFSGEVRPVNAGPWKDSLVTLACLVHLEGKSGQQERKKV